MDDTGGMNFPLANYSHGESVKSPISRGIDESIFSRIRAIVTGSAGLRWLQLLHGLRTTGRSPDSEKQLIDEMVGMGICTRVGSAWQMTSFGSKCADSAREYLFWIGRDRRMLGEDEHPYTTLRNFSGKAVLEIGPGWGGNLVRFANFGASAVGVEVEPVYIQFSRILAAREDLSPPQIVLGVGEQTPFRGDQFDCILLMSVLQYMEVHRALEECKRILRVGGIILAFHTFLHRYALLQLKGAIKHHSPRILRPIVPTIINTAWYECTGARFLDSKRTSATARPIYFSNRSFVMDGEGAGLKFKGKFPLRTTTERSLLILEKTAD